MGGSCAAIIARCGAVGTGLRVCVRAPAALGLPFTDMTLGHPPLATLALRVDKLDQLFNALDPSPFLTKDLAHSTESYIERWALPLPSGCRLQLTIEVGEVDCAEAASELIEDAIHHHFGDKATLERAELRLLLRHGRISLVIGLLFVAGCLLAAEALTSPGQGTARSIARESLTIIGWVAMWRPVQIFLYDWWPLLGRIKSFDNLQGARIRVVARATAGHHSDQAAQ